MFLGNQVTFVGWNLRKSSLFDDNHDSVPPHHSRPLETQYVPFARIRRRYLLLLRGDDLCSRCYFGSLFKNDASVLYPPNSQLFAVSTPTFRSSFLSSSPSALFQPRHVQAGVCQQPLHVNKCDTQTQGTPKWRITLQWTSCFPNHMRNFCPFCQIHHSRFPLLKSTPNA